MTRQLLPATSRRSHGIASFIGYSQHLHGALRNNGTPDSLTTPFSLAPISECGGKISVLKGNITKFEEEKSQLWPLMYQCSNTDKNKAPVYLNSLIGTLPICSSWPSLLYWHQPFLEDTPQLATILSRHLLFESGMSFHVWIVYHLRWISTKNVSKLSSLTMIDRFFDSFYVKRCKQFVRALDTAMTLLYCIEL